MIIVLLADGFEEIEALTPVDLLRRAGHEVKTVGVTAKIAVGSHGIPVVADLSPDEVKLEEVTMAIFPGGMPGSLNLDASPFTDKVIEAVSNNGGRLAAICAAPLVLGRRGILEGKRATCFPGFENELRGATVTGDEFVTDGHVTTGKGMEYSLPFAKELVRLANGEVTKEELLSKLDDALGGLIEESEPTDEDDLFDDIVPEEVDDDCEKSDPVAPFPATGNEELDREIRELAASVIETLGSFDIKASLKHVDVGPRIIRLAIVPAPDVRISQITALFDDICLVLGVSGVRMLAPIPDKAAIGFEIPRRHPEVVKTLDMLDSDEFITAKSNTTVCIGKGADGKSVLGDVAKFPHAIVAGATGSGKSVVIHSIIASLVRKASPDRLRLLLIDPKRVEFCVYSDLPHLLTPVISDADQAAGALAWAVGEMERRYELLARVQARNIDGYNEKVKADPSLGTTVPRIVIVIDELADLMVARKTPIEDLIMRIAQKARAAGIHIIIATQRASTSVITGCIKANIPTRIALKTASVVDSRVILDSAGAEKLLSFGDMLYSSVEAIAPIRVQGCYVSDTDIGEAVAAAKASYGECSYDTDVIAGIDAEVEKLKERYTKAAEEPEEDEGESSYYEDSLFLDAVELAIRSGSISTSMLQRKFRIGFGKAARFIDAMEEIGVISEPNGMKPRVALITMDEWREKLKRIN